MTDNELKLPWAVGRESDYEDVWFITINERSHEKDRHDLIWVLDRGGDVARKRADLIVRAVNRDALFDELVEALQLAEQLYQHGLLSAPDGLAQRVVEARRAALAKVRDTK